MRQPHKMVKHTRAIYRPQTMNCLTMFDHYVGLALKGLRRIAYHFETYVDTTSIHFNPVGTGRKLNVHKTFRRRPGRLLNVLCTSCVYEERLVS